MPLTVKELKEKLPLAEVTELRDGVKYIVRVKGRVDPPMMNHVRDALAGFGLNALVIDDTIELFEIVENSQ